MKIFPGAALKYEISARILTLLSQNHIIRAIYPLSIIRERSSHVEESFSAEKLWARKRNVRHYVPFLTLAFFSKPTKNEFSAPHGYHCDTKPCRTFQPTLQGSDAFVVLSPRLTRVLFDSGSATLLAAEPCMQPR